MTTNPITTGVPAWAPDIQSFVPGDVIPEALILQCSQVATTLLEGDSPLARVPYVDDDEATFVGEGTPIPEGDPILSEALVATGKVSMLLRISNEQFGQTNAASMLSDSARRGVIKKGNLAFISQDPPVGPEVSPPGGIIYANDVLEGGTVEGDLDTLVDLVAEIEGNGGTATHFVLAPTTWAALRKMKTADESNVSLLGAGTNDAERRLLDVPVLVSPAVEEGYGIVLDRNAIVSAVGPVQVARSEHVFFGADSMALRVTWRMGATVMRPDRVAVFDVGLITSS